MRFKQNSFIGGLVTTEAQERSDKPIYYHSMRQADNVVLCAQGGVSRRSGTQFIAELQGEVSPIATGFSLAAPNGGDVTKLTNGNLSDYFKTTAPINATDHYVVLLCTFSTATYIDMFDINFVSIDNGTNKSPIGTSEFHIQTTTDGIAWTTVKDMYISNTYDDSYRAEVHGHVVAVRLVRLGTTMLTNYIFLCGGISIYTLCTAQGAFRLAPLVMNYTNNFLLVLTDRSINVYKDTVLICTLPAPQVAQDLLEQVKFSAFGESLILTHQDIPQLMIQRYKSDTVWRIYPLLFSAIPRFYSGLERHVLDGASSVTETSGTYLVTSDSDNFHSADLGCMIYGSGGSGRIIAYNDPKTVQITVINKFASYGPTKRTGWTLDRMSVPLWGPEYGYPECSSFFGNRLWFGGFRRSPMTMSGSVIGDYTNFDQGDGSDDDAVVVALTSGASNHNIRYIFSYDNLEVFTETGIFAMKKVSSGSVASLASAFYFCKPIGIEPYIAPFRVEDGGTMLIKQGRSDIREITYDDNSYSYSAKSRSVWFSDAIRGAQSVCVVRSDEQSVSSTIYVVTGSGSMACITCLLSDDVHGATIWQTTGKFLSCESTLRQGYVVVLRSGKKILEKISASAMLDCEKQFNRCTGGALSGLRHLSGQTVQVRADDEYLGEFLVSSDGTVTIPTGIWDVVHIGYGFTSVVVPVPPDIPQDPITGRWMNYQFAVLSCYDTQDIMVDGYSPEFLGRTAGTMPGAAMQYKTGRYRVMLGGGPDVVPELRITQDKPLLFHLRSVAYDVGISSQHRR